MTDISITLSPQHPQPAVQLTFPPFSYRTRDEVQEVRKTKDPITQLKSFILEGELATAAELKVSLFLGTVFQFYDLLLNF